MCVRLQEGHGAVDAHLVVEIVLEDVEVHQAVRLLADGGRQVVCDRSLGYTVEVRRLRAGERCAVRGAWCAVRGAW